MPTLDPQTEFVEGRAYVDWDQRGAIILEATGEKIGTAMQDLDDDIIASGLRPPGSHL